MRRAAVVLLALLGPTVALTGDGRSPAPSVCQSPPRPAGLPEADVTRISDGDTVDVQPPGGRRERVRMVGIDTPEVHESRKLDRDAQRSGRSKAAIQELGRLASEFTRRHLLGATVGLEVDVKPRDYYGRLLAYLWLPDGTLYNLLMLGEGYAQILTVPPNVKYVELFVNCSREARERQRGLWGR